MITKTIYQYIRYVVNKIGHNVAALKMGNDYEFIIFSTFEPSQSGGSSTIDYCTFRGIILTDFFKTVNMDLKTNERAFIQLFSSNIQTEEEVYIKFNKSIEYLIFTQ